MNHAVSQTLIDRAIINSAIRCATAVCLVMLAASAAAAQTPQTAAASDTTELTAAKTTKLPSQKAHCSAPRDLVLFKAALPGLERAVAKGRDIDIVALGSSSTAGSGASSPQAAYPARLDAELDRRFPAKDFHVDNQGAGGQLARDMLERIHSYIATLQRAPALVIWQTGVNDAMQDVGVADFAAVLERGIRDLRAAGIDVVLVDMQYFPRSERVAVYGDYLRVMRQVAEEHKVPLFQRFAIMKHLVKSGQHTTDQLLAPDNFHLNDLSYGCLADLMADAIEDKLKAGRVTASQLQPVR